MLIGEYMAKEKKQVHLESTKKQVDKEVSSLGLNYHKIMGIILLLIGIVLVAVNWSSRLS